MSKMAPMIQKERPYRPIWIDRFNSRVQALPVRAPIFFVVAGFVLVGVQLLFLGLDGGLQMTLLPVIIFNGFFAPYLMGLIYLLDRQAVTALHAMRTALTMAAGEFE